MADDRTIARRYARAFLELAQEAHTVDALAADLDRALAGVNANDRQLFDALCNPVFTVDERSHVLSQVLPKLGVTPLTGNLLKVLLEKGRFSSLPEVVTLFHGFADEQAGRARVTVETAEPMSAQLEAEVRASLEKVTGKTVVLETKVVPALIGGIVARVGDTVYDASVRTRLLDIKHRLLTTRTPAEA